MIPVVIYASKSSPDPKDSTASQIAACRQAIEREGGRTLYGEPFHEENVSGYQRSRGPELSAALRAAGQAAAEHGTAELWVFHSTRLGRGSGLKDQARSLLEIFTDLRRRGVTIRSVEDDPFVTNQMLVGIAAEQASKYSTDLSAHVRRGKKAQLERGERLGGPVPDGYLLRVVRDGRDQVVQRVYEFDPEREPILRRLFELALQGHGAPAVARALNREGHRTKAGKAWTRRRVQETLKSPFYAGLAAQRGEKVGPSTYQRYEQPNLRAGHWPGYVTMEQYERIQSGMVERDRSAKGRVKEGRRTTRYALARLAVCDRCGERMYAVTSPYKRKDGSHARRYVCTNARDATGLCSQAPLDAALIDAAVVEHLNRLFIDFEAWLTELARGQGERRAQLEAALADLLTKQATINRREEKLRDRYFAALDGTDAAEAAAYELYQHVLQEREVLQGEIQAAQAELAATPDEPPTDAMLDLYNDLARAVRGTTDDDGNLGALNDRLRAVFSEFRLDEVEAGLVGVMPMLKEGVLKRTDPPLIIGPDGAALAPNLPTTVPVALFVSPPVKPLALSTERGLHTHAYLWTKWKRPPFASSQA